MGDPASGDLVQVIGKQIPVCIFRGRPPDDPNIVFLLVAAFGIVIFHPYILVPCHMAVYKEIIGDPVNYRIPPVRHPPFPVKPIPFPMVIEPAALPALAIAVIIPMMGFLFITPPRPPIARRFHGTGRDRAENGQGHCQSHQRDSLFFHGFLPFKSTGLTCLQKREELSSLLSHEQNHKPDSVTWYPRRWPSI